MKIVDLKEMPKFNGNVKNGIDSVSSGKVYIKWVELPCWTKSKRLSYLKEYAFPYCKEHGAINKVTKDGIWRCLTCNEGCWEVIE